MNGRHVFQMGGPGQRALLVLGLALLGSPRASASPPEVLSELALHPTDPRHVVLAYAGGGQGLLFSDDGGHHFRLRCGAAVGRSFTKSRSPLALTHDGQLLLGTFEGLLRGAADGCGFGVAPELAGKGVADIAADPRSGDILYLAVRDGEGSMLVRREADGASRELRERDDRDAGQSSWLIDRVRVAALPDGGLRFYTSGLRAEPDGRYTPVLRRSDDGGSSWVTLELPAPEGARVFLLAVDPSNPDRLALSLARNGARDALLIGDDAGASLETRLEVHALAAVAVAPDGRLWVGDGGGDAEYGQPGGLNLLDGFDAPARELARWPVRCLGYRAFDGALLGCTRSELGRVELDTGTFTALAAFGTVDSFVSCAGEDLVAACQRQLCDNWCGVLHHAEAPLCDAYHEVSPVCGPAARGYGSRPAPATPASPPAIDEALATAGAVPTPATGVAASNVAQSGPDLGGCSFPGQSGSGFGVVTWLASATLLAFRAVAAALSRRSLRSMAPLRSQGAATRDVHLAPPGEESHGSNDDHLRFRSLAASPATAGRRTARRACLLAGVFVGEHPGVGRGRAGHRPDGRRHAYLIGHISRLDSTRAAVARRFRGDAASAGLAGSGRERRRRRLRVVPRARRAQRKLPVLSR